MNQPEHDRITELLQQALPPIGDGSEPSPDLWPAMSRKLSARPAAIPWFDWVLMGGLAASIVAFPVSIPMLFYYL